MNNFVVCWNNQLKWVGTSVAYNIVIYMEDDHFCLVLYLIDVPAVMCRDHDVVRYLANDVQLFNRHLSKRFLQTSISIKKKKKSLLVTAHSKLNRTITPCNQCQIYTLPPLIL